MELDNHTPFPAHLFRTSIDDTRFAAAVIVRVTYDIALDGTCRPSKEQDWPVSVGPWESDYGMMESDDVFIRGGVDIFVFGSARALHREPVQAMQVVVQLGDFVGQVWVYGERRWERGPGGLVATAPASFEVLHLTLAHAFGGTVQWDGLDIEYPENPDGLGFYLDEEAALGGALPNIEDPGAPVGSWEDKPSPVGVGACPFSHGVRLENMVFNDRGLLQEVRPRFFNAAFPAMIAESAAPGDVLTIHGVRHEGPLVVQLPHHRMRVQLTFDDEVIERRPAVDQIGVEPDRGRMFVTYRHPFRYVLHPLQRRTCTLSED